MTPGPQREAWPWVVGLIAAASTLTPFFYADYPDGPDAREYVALGGHLAQTGELRLPTGEMAKRPPVYPLLIAAFYQWQGPEHWRNALLLGQALLAWTTCMLIASTARCAADGRAATLAGLTAALYAPWRYLQSCVLCETTVIFLISAALWCYVRWLGRAQRRPTPLGGISLIIGLAGLARVDAGALLPAFAIDAMRRAHGGRARATAALCILAPALICAGGWGWRNYGRVGAFTLSTATGLNLYLGHNPHYAGSPGLANADYAAFDRLRRAGLSEIDADRQLRRQAVEFVVAHPGMTAANCARKVIVWLRSSVSPAAPSLVLLVLAALVWAGLATLRPGRAAAPHRTTVFIALAATLVVGVWWLLALQQTLRPWVTPGYLVPAGVIGLAVARGAIPIRGPLTAPVLCNLAVAVAFIPLERLRWTIDGVFMIAVAVAVSGVARKLASGRPVDGPAGPRATG